MTVGYFAPMPPARTGVADYAEALFHALQRHGSLELAPRRASVNLYHLGNNHLHAAIYRRALSEPGIVVLHDAVLHHFLLGQLARSEYITEFVYNYGEWSRDLAAELWDRRASSASDERYFSHPMLRRICETARAVVVHNPAAARMVQQHAPSTDVVEIPHLHFAVREHSAADVLDARKSLAVPSREPLCGLFGHLRQSKRVRTVVEACGEAGVKLLIAGECTAELAKALEPLFSSSHVIRRGFSNVTQFNLLHHAVDICANLRYPSAGETSGISVRLMAAGKPVILTHSEENSRYPETSCIRVQAGLPERAHLTDLLRWLKRFPSDAAAVGLRARDHILAQHAPDRVAGLYWGLLRAFS
ncbi:MAG: hypothetical protein H7039_19020 [Bryobacteraceae bacterium]|nr:hypothetical protein [Bryobacteraceae bacterium]